MNIKKYLDERKTLTDPVKLSDKYNLFEGLRTPQAKTNSRNKKRELSKTMH